MALNRREFLAGTAGLLASAPALGQSGGQPATTPNFATIRNDFPWIENQTYINNAGVHPVSAPAARVIQQHLAYKVHGPGPDRLFIGEPEIEELKVLYGRLINAKPTEVALVQSTLDGENVVAAGLGLHRGGGLRRGGGPRRDGFGGGAGGDAKQPHHEQERPAIGCPREGTTNQGFAFHK